MGKERIGPRKNLLTQIIQSKYLLLLFAPAFIYLVIFKYVPMYGVLIAFKDFSFKKGILGSDWVGFKHFTDFFESYNFKMIMTNTVVISLKKIVFGFPAPIILALLLNEMTNVKLKKTVQTVVYLPHFVSWVVLASLSVALFSAQSGAVTVPLAKLFGVEKINILQNKEIFQEFLVISDIWKGIGWGSIIYLSALTGVDPQLYEAARLDGANRLKQMLHITMPCIMPVVLIMFVLRLGGVLDAGFEQILMLSNPFVVEKAEIIDTFVYNVGILNGDYAYSAAVGLFKGIIGMGFILTANGIVKKMGGEGLV